MAFVMIATGATSRSRVRTLPVRPLIALAGVAALALLGSGGALGYWLAEEPLRALPSAAVAAPEALALPFTLEQVGAISGRLFRLESEAAQLSKRIGVLNTETPASARAPAGRDARPVAEPAGSSGGPLLPERSETSSLGAIDAQLGRVEQQIASVAGAAAQQSLALMRLPTRLPIAGAELTSTFGNRVDPFAHTHAFHAGLDFAARIGTPIAAAAGGVIAFAGFKRDFGWVVEIDHGNGLATRYAHASELLVQAGQVVVPGDRIAMVGSTGRSTGPHLHFEVLRSGDHVDPRRYLAGL
ncbi:MAG: M23 family metallopeptidase [Pseudomonadota bacterium]|nr:M23 family metallopeptidase [Pseudomonadota bacterium]